MNTFKLINFTSNHHFSVSKRGRIIYYKFNLPTDQDTSDQNFQHWSRFFILIFFYCCSWHHRVRAGQKWVIATQGDSVGFKQWLITHKTLGLLVKLTACHCRIRSVFLPFTLDWSWLCNHDNTSSITWRASTCTHPVREAPCWQLTGRQEAVG